MLEDAQTCEALGVHDGGFEGHVFVNCADDDHSLICLQFCEVFKDFYLAELDGGLCCNSPFSVYKSVVIRMRILKNFFLFVDINKRII